MLNRRMLLTLGALALMGCGKKSSQGANATEVKEFFDAVNDGDADVVARLLRTRPYLANVKNDAGQTPLAVAKTKGNDELVDAIRKAGGKE
jgi:hypothetical protein